MAPFWDHFDTILGPFWSLLGVILVTFGYLLGGSEKSSFLMTFWCPLGTLPGTIADPFSTKNRPWRFFGDLKSQIIFLKRSPRTPLGAKSAILDASGLFARNAFLPRKNVHLRPLEPPCSRNKILKRPPGRPLDAQNAVLGASEKDARTRCHVGSVF